MSDEETFVVVVTSVTEDETGGATLGFDLNEVAEKKLAKVGLEFVLYCAAYEMDLQYVLDNIHTLKRGYDLESAFD